MTQRDSRMKRLEKRLKELEEDLRDAMQHLDWASIRLNILISTSLEVLVAYEKYADSIKSAMWLAERCEKLSEKLRKKVGK